MFAQVCATLSSSQKTNLAALRHHIISGTYVDGTPFDLTFCTNHYLHSAVITDTNVLAPYITNTDYLFIPPTAAPPFNVVLDRTDKLTFEQAQALLARLNAAKSGGFDDWRSPSVKKLESIVDYSRSPDTSHSPEIDLLFTRTAITNEARQLD